MNNKPQSMDLYVFTQTVLYQSFAKTAEMMGVSPAYISKRMAILEKTLGCLLFHRNTRTLKLTEKGERIHEWAIRILADMDSMLETAQSRHGNPAGLLKISSSVGFGRNHVAPLLAQLAQTYPLLAIRFNTIDEIPAMTDYAFDLDVRIGNSIAEHLISKPICGNKRILCAAPGYLAKHGTPKTLNDLAQHNCLIIKERDHPFGVWTLNHSQGEQLIKVEGNLASNNGEIVCQWARMGAGIMLRSRWDIAQDLARGDLIQVLPEYWQNADVYAVYPFQLRHSEKLKICVDFLEAQLPLRLDAKSGLMDIWVGISRT